ncbi:DUF3140 domain-containing protein [Streptomyces xantholiticus]|uniref:DUF3140 domain-containing protein n=1 Tax=Streptomyces xantholiticus TaxID=68285 RepID=UPI00167485CD|nr:DUF3140 domain-containing protein [Streptomyces xantholiticus]GGW39201.1 hypothetical protein GCM10010381_24860 [Streptomyces xantholiticus]
MTNALELDALWDEFHRVVNMTSQELSAWLQTRDAGEDTDPLPDQAGSPTGRHVLAILQKRRTDLTDDDVRVMYEVVETVQAQRQEQGAAVTVDDTRRRHRLMTLGHDPLKAG